MIQQLGRILTAMVTPFNEIDEVDYEQAGKLAIALLDSGSDGVVVSGTTGESSALSSEEKLRLFAEVKQAVSNRGIVVAGTGSNNTKQSISLTKEAERAGVDAILSVVPYYNKPTQEGLFQHFEAIAGSTSLPCILYNIPSRSAVNLSADTTIRLSRISNIVGIKEASGNLEQVTKIIDGAEEGFLLYSGDDSSTLPILSLGGYGVVSIVSHLVGNQLREMMDHFLDGDVQTASRIHRHLLPLMKSLFITTNPAPIKYALSLIGCPTGKPRLPLTELDAESKVQVEAVMRNYRIDLAEAGNRNEENYQLSGPQRTVVWFDEVGKDDIALVGGKGANLGEMTKAGIPVPPGFIITSDTYFQFVRMAGLENEIRKKIEGVDIEDSERLQAVASEVKDMISITQMPSKFAEEIKEAYRKMGCGPVAVRSSATAEDLPEASFAGQQSTFLNVEGEDGVVTAVIDCWASLFESRAIYYRVQQGFDHFKVGIAVPVQRMVQSEVSGVMFTAEPVNNDRNKIAIEAAYGLGEVVVSGVLSPDFYIVDKNDFTIVDKKIIKQEWRLIRNSEPREKKNTYNIKEDIPSEKQSIQKLSDAEVVQLAKLGNHIEDVYESPQDIEWAKEGSDFFIVQSRAITTLKDKTQTETALEGKVLFNGLAASPGTHSGQVRIIRSPSEINRVQQGDILVAGMTTPDFVPAMKRAAAIVTDRGGRTCHAAIISRELGVPCVVGSEIATVTLVENQVITVDGFAGIIYEGNVIKEQSQAPTIIRKKIHTRTKVYVNSAHPDLAEIVAKRDVDGVGLLRAEFMVADIGEHPLHMLSEGRGHAFTDKLAYGLETFTRVFNPRPVVYRTTDFKTNEYRNLKGGAKYEGEEENPMLGYRGCSRYVKERDVFKLEIEAIKKVRESYDNLWVMIPFVRTVKGMILVKQILEEEGLHQSDSFKLWMMAEVPSNAILLDKFISEARIDGISIGSNDLTQLVLGVDRDNPAMATEFDERDEAVSWALERLITTAKANGITSSICGQAPSDYPELTQKLVRWGINSISVNPDVIERTREIIADAENKLEISLGGVALSAA